MSYIKQISLIAIAALILSIAMPFAMAQSAPPTTVAGTVFVDGAATNGAHVSYGGVSVDTHTALGADGKYSIDVTPGTVTLTATYNGLTGSTGPFTIDSGEMATRDIYITTPAATPTATPTPTPTATPVPSPSPTATPTAMPTATPTATPTPAQGTSQGDVYYKYGTPTPVTHATVVPDPTVTPTATPTSTPLPTVTATVSATATATPTSATQSARSPGFEAVLMLVAISGAAFLLMRRNK